MSGDIYNCDKCGESIHTSCDCGFPNNATMEKENLELRALVNLADEIIGYAEFVGVNCDSMIAKWDKKAEKYKQGSEDGN